MIELRPYQPADALALLDLFRDTIRRVNRRDYDDAQVMAWSSDEIDPDQWAARFEGRSVVVAIEHERPVGFAELEADGHIDRFYVSADHQSQGIGRGLLTSIIEEARRLGLPRLFVEASVTARPFFESHGFVTLAEQEVNCRGVLLTNFRMERRLTEPDGGRN